MDHAQRVEAGAWLRARRRERGYETAAAFARVLGVDASMISNYERGANAVDDARAAQIADTLGLPEIVVRRHVGLWVPDDVGEPVSTLQAIAMDPLLDDEERRHFVNQYELLTRLSRYRRQAELTDDEAIELVEREHPGAIAQAVGNDGANPEQPGGKADGKPTRRSRASKAVTQTDETA